MWRSKTFLEIATLLAAKLAAPYNPTRLYNINQLICAIGGSLISIATANTTGTYNPSHWAFLLDYSPSTNYTPGATVQYNQYLYICIANTTGTFNPEHWKALQKIEILQWMDVWNSQTEHIGDTGENTELPYPMPSIFIEFHNTTWVNLGGSSGIQKGDAEIRIHVVQEAYTESYDNSASQAHALATLDYLDQIHIALQFKSGTYFTPLNRTEEILDPNHPNYSHHIIAYRTTIEDPAAVAEPTLHQPEHLHINPKYTTGVGGSYKMMSKIEPTLEQNQPPEE